VPCDVALFGDTHFPWVVPPDSPVASAVHPAARRPDGSAVVQVGPVPVQMWEGVSPVPAQMWAGVSRVGPGADVGRGEPAPAQMWQGVSPVPAQMWEG
jgi:hypothetical protein